MFPLGMSPPAAFFASMQSPPRLAERVGETMAVRPLNAELLATVRKAVKAHAVSGTVRAAIEPLIEACEAALKQATQSIEGGVHVDRALEQWAVSYVRLADEVDGCNSLAGVWKDSKGPIVVSALLLLMGAALLMLLGKVMLDPSGPDSLKAMAAVALGFPSAFLAFSSWVLLKQSKPFDPEIAGRIRTYVHEKREEQQLANQLAVRPMRPRVSQPGAGADAPAGSSVVSTVDSTVDAPIPLPIDSPLHPPAPT